jgi:hypothetical protein
MREEIVNALRGVAESNWFIEMVRGRFEDQFVFSAVAILFNALDLGVMRDGRNGLLTSLSEA